MKIKNNFFFIKMQCIIKEETSGIQSFVFVNNYVRKHWTKLPYLYIK